MKKASKTKNNSTRSLEKLSHFRCGHCDKWWSIADAPARKKWWCPWCGEVIIL